MPRHNWRKMIEARLILLNDIDSQYPLKGTYSLHGHGPYYCLISREDADYKKISSYLPLSQLWEWLDGYMIAVQHMSSQCKESS